MDHHKHLWGALGALLALAHTPAAQDVETSFEFTDLSGSFSLGTAPFDATFEGGVAQTVGIPNLYTSGLNSWMIGDGNTGTITFGTPAERLDLFFKDQFDTVLSVLTITDTNGGTMTFNGTTTFQNVSVTAPATGPFFESVTLDHNGRLGVTVIDDFSYFGVGGEGGNLALDDPIPERIRPSAIKIELEPVTTGIVAPNWGFADPVGLNRLFVSDQPGLLLAIDLATGTPSVFLDVSAQLVPLGIIGPGTFDERGLLGFAFHPDYANNGLLYTYTSEPAVGSADFSTLPMGVAADHHTVITEWHVPSPNLITSVVDPASERELMRIDQPQFNHDGGCLNFGPGDNWLYIALGDGGGADDEGDGHGLNGNGLDASNPLGALLRIDPLGSNSANGNYGIPVSNPFVGVAGLDEIYAYGFRNPFRFSFDTATGALLLADVGQNDIEEINIVQAGLNYGWRHKEGSFFFDPNGPSSGFVTDVAPPGLPPLEDPVGEYDHDEGISIIGGFVYRGTALPALQGRYVFGDYSQTFFGNDGRLFEMLPSGEIRELLLPGSEPAGLSILGFGQDAAGELYVLGNTTGVPFGSTGVVLRIVPADPGGRFRRAAAPKGSVNRFLR